MSYLAIIGGAAAVIFSVRFAGFLPQNKTLSPFWERFFRYVPLGTFTALVVPAYTKANGNLLPELLATGVAAVSVRASKQMWVGILTGMLTFWLVKDFRL